MLLTSVSNAAIKALPFQAAKFRVPMRGMRSGLKAKALVTYAAICALHGSDERSNLFNIKDMARFLGHIAPSARTLQRHIAILVHAKLIWCRHGRIIVLHFKNSEPYRVIDPSIFGSAKDANSAALAMVIGTYRSFPERLTWAHSANLMRRAGMGSVLFWKTLNSMENEARTVRITRRREAKTNRIGNNVYEIIAPGSPAASEDAVSECSLFDGQRPSPPARTAERSANHVAAPARQYTPCFGPCPGGEFRLTPIEVGRVRHKSFTDKLRNHHWMTELGVSRDLIEPLAREDVHEEDLAEIALCRTEHKSNIIYINAIEKQSPGAFGDCGKV